MKKYSLTAKFMFIVGGLAVATIMIAYLGWSGMTSIEDDMQMLSTRIAMQTAKIKVGSAVTADQLKDINGSVETEFQDAKRHAESIRLSILLWLVGSVSVGVSMAVVIILQIRRSINRVVENLAMSSGEVETASRQVSDSATKLSQSATEQAASLQQTAASSEELTGMVQRNQETASRASNVSGTSLASAQKGKRVVEDMTRAIAEIDTSNQNIMNQVIESNRQISEITKVIAEIGNKTKVINDIVFQTKLLSFNASVEAARAGEHGKGFAVVAEEVGNLAQMSGTAAKEISEMLDSSIHKVESIVNDTKSSVGQLVSMGKEKVEAGARIAQQCADVLDEIVANVGDVSRMSTDISGASREQAQGVSEISRAMAQLDFVTQTNAAAAEQAASAATSLSDQAQSMKQTVRSLLEVVNGSGDSDVVSSKAAAKPAPQSFAPKRTAAPKTASAARAAAAASTLKPSEKPSEKPSLKPASALKPRPPAKLSMVKPSTSAKATSAGAPADGAKSPAIKLAAGAEIEIPSEDDPRFKDV